MAEEDVLRLIRPHCRSQNTWRLVRGLFRRGVVIEFDGDLHIGRWRGNGPGSFQGQPADLAPTWYLGTEDLMPLSITWEGRDYSEICSYLPLTWILKHPPAEWNLGIYASFAPMRLEVTVPELPPYWNKEK